MTRRTSMLVGAAIALASVTVVIALSGLLAADRRRDRDRYERAIERQRREAGQAAARPDDARSERRDTVLCVTGVDTFVTALHDALGTSVLDDERRLKPAELRRLSELATRATRYVEQARAGPALPQRMGRERAVDDAGAPTWVALSPPVVECEGGDAYAAFRLDTRTPAAAPPRPAGGAAE